MLAGAPQRFAVEGHGGFARRWSGGGADDDPLRPGAQCRFQCVAVHMSKNRVQRRRTGGVVGKAQRLGDTVAVIAPPFGDGAIAARATQHRTTGQREYSGQGMAFAPMAAKVWNLGEDLDEGLRLCYHDGPPAERVLVHVRCAGKARPHVEQNPVTHCRLVVQPHVRKLNDPACMYCTGRSSNVISKEAGSARS